MGITHVKADEPADVVTDALEADGAVIVEGLLDADLLARFNVELDPMLDAARPDHGRYVNEGVAAFFGDRTRHVLGVAGKSRSSPPRCSPTPCTGRPATGCCCPAAPATGSTSPT